MNYLDNPWRPRHRMWFGPRTMIQFMMDCGYLPGTTHDISMFPMKQGVGGALTDIQNNHPNDLVAMLLFSRPVFGNDPPGIGQFNVPQYSLTNDYSTMLTSLWVPPGSGSLGSDVNLRRPQRRPDPARPRRLRFQHRQQFWLYAGLQPVQRQPLALVNVPAWAAGTPTTVGGLGRKGATRLVIFETDGMANEDSMPQSGSGVNQWRLVQLLLQHPADQTRSTEAVITRTPCSRWLRRSVTATTARRFPSHRLSDAAQCLRLRHDQQAGDRSVHCLRRHFRDLQ